MNRFELIAPCHFGMEAVLKREIYDLGYDIEQVEDGKVTFIGDEEAICRANVFLRTTERILLKVGKFKATTFDELFENIIEIVSDIEVLVLGRATELNEEEKNELQNVIDIFRSKGII